VLAPGVVEQDVGGLHAGAAGAADEALEVVGAHAAAAQLVHGLEARAERVLLEDAVDEQGQLGSPMRTRASCARSPSGWGLRSTPSPPRRMASSSPSGDTQAESTITFVQWSCRRRSRRTSSPSAFPMALMRRSRITRS